MNPFLRVARRVVVFLLAAGGLLRLALFMASPRSTGTLGIGLIAGISTVGVLAVGITWVLWPNGIRNAQLVAREPRPLLLVTARRTAVIFGFCGLYLVLLFLLPIPEGVTESPWAVIIVIPLSFVLLVVYAARLVATASRMKKLLVSRGLVVRTAPDIRTVLGYQDWLSREGMTIDEVRTALDAGELRPSV